MIELKTLDKTFQMIHASDHITATIPDGMAFGLIGSNGAGKSTLLRMISGILKPDEGEVLIDGESVFENPSVKSQICFFIGHPLLLSECRYPTDEKLLHALLPVV